MDKLELFERSVGFLIIPRDNHGDRDDNVDNSDGDHGDDDDVYS